jgi:hypothetical protein
MAVSPIATAKNIRKLGSPVKVSAKIAPNNSAGHLASNGGSNATAAPNAALGGTMRRLPTR